MTKKNSLGTGAIIGLLAGCVLIVFLLLSAFGVLNNFLGWDAQQAGIGWKIVMLAFLGGAGYLIFLLASGKLQVNIGFTLLLVVLLGLAIGSSTGFKFTAGDIGQRVSAFNGDGKIVDESVLFKYYSEFYHLDTDTALVNYIRTYKELPGRNNHNAYIVLWLRGDTVNGRPPSTAPRANEQFEWHSHNDNSVYKDGQ